MYNCFVNNLYMEVTMKTTKLIIGIISIVLCGLIIFQSCAVGVGNAVEGNGETSGSSGLFLAISMLIAGIIGIATRNGVAGGLVSSAFYALGGLIGISNYGSYGDLKIWSILSLFFALIFLIGTIASKRNNNNVNNETEPKN